MSVNQDTGVDTGALLQGDADEELRMKDRLIEKSDNAKEGKMKRVTVEDIRPSQRNSPDELLSAREAHDDKLLNVVPSPRKGSGKVTSPSY